MVTQLFRPRSFMTQLRALQAAFRSRRNRSSWSMSVEKSRYWKVTKFMDDEAVRVQRSFLSNVVTDDHCRRRSRMIRVMGFPVFEWKKGKKDKIKVLGFRPYLRDNGKVLVSRIVDAVPQGCDHIYICRHNIGETYIYLSLIDEAIGRNKSVQPVLIVRKKEYLSLYEMLMPKSASLVYVPILRSDLDDHVENDLCHRGRRIIAGSKDILDRLRSKKALNQTANFVDFMRSDMGLKGSARMREPVVREVSRSRLKDKMKAIDLNLAKFILLTPEASTVRELDDDFWSCLIDPLLARGFSIYVNHAHSAHSKYPLKSAPLSIEEVYLLAQQAKGIIGVASGLNVLLSATRTPMDILYTDTGGGCSAAEIMELFSMSNLPQYSPVRIREYDTDRVARDVIVAEIVSRYSY